jgi:glycine reductase complex component B subunit gamma
VLEKEIESLGIPTVLIATLTSTAKMVGAKRIIQGMGITNPVGNPRVPQEEEKVLRTKLIHSALMLLTEN